MCCNGPTSLRSRGFASCRVGTSGFAWVATRCWVTWAGPCQKLVAIRSRFSKALRPPPTAEQLSMAPGVRVLNKVVLNQVLVRIGDSDERTRSVISRVQEQGRYWLGGTTWKGQAAIRISVSSHSTTEEDADRSVRAILEAAAA